MRDAEQMERPIRRSRWAPLLGIGLALGVLGGTLVWSALDLRGRIRTQIVQRDGEILDAVTLMQHLDDRTSGETIASLEDLGEQVHLALKVSRLRNVLGVRLYSADGKFLNAFPAYITEQALPAADLKPLQSLQPVSRFLAGARLQEQDLLAETNTPPTPLLSVEVPLRSEDDPKLAGTIEFLMEGASILRQYAELDRNLALKFSAAFLVGAGVLLAGLGLALRSVQRANRRLAERTSSLLRANRELALAARTSAVGAVASHLIHGLKNPLHGLRNFVHAHNGDGSVVPEGDWQAALSTTQRMEELINRVVRVLQEQQTGAVYEISIAELLAMLADKAKNLAESTGVRLETRAPCDGLLSNRDADLILLILENLVQNGIEATPTGRSVEVSAVADGDAMRFEVRDHGTGLASGQAGRLFMPCTSRKKGGGGIGLTISKQLAQSLGATLELADSSSAGCVFRLLVPRKPAETAPPAGKETPVELSWHK